VISVALLLVIVAMPLGASASTTFWLDQPADGAVVTGIVEVSGWAIDDRGVSEIDLYVDGAFVASADLNIPRYDVLQAYPWIAGTINARPGFSVSFTTGSLSNGEHTLFLRISFSDASEGDFGHRTVTVDRQLNQTPFGEIDLPRPNQPMSGVFPISGWALDDVAVEDVDIEIDGAAWGETVMGIHRPDIYNRFPDVPGSEYAGWIYNINTTALTNGVHTLTVRLRDGDGATRVIGHRLVQVFNVGYNLAPFGEIEWPLPDHYMFAVGCYTPGGWSGGEYEDPRTVELISGWALDVGSRTDMGGVKWLELLINGTRQKSTLIDDIYYPDFEMDVNYYGHERLDIFRLYADVPNAKHSGFTFALDVSDLIINHNYHEGLHYLTVRASDIEGNIADIGTIPVIFDCNDDPDRPSWGDIDTPTHMERTQGTILVTGWAIDYERVHLVEVWVDGIFMGYATYGLASPDVVDDYPWWPYSLTANCRYSFNLDTTQLQDGEHELVIRTVDRFDGATYIGQRTFVIDNLN
jgi:hypothetical protein